MKRFLHAPIITLSPATYLSLIIFLGPFANFLGGITLDIYAPSMPAIAHYFNVDVMTMKNTVSFALFGWAIGAITFGILIDSIGRKKVLISGLLLYITASFLAPFCHSIHELMIIRFLQGFAVASITIGVRVLIVDMFSGKRYAIAILYVSIGYGLGPIIAPFVGGFLQHYFGWKANFLVLALYSLIVLLTLLFFVKESIPVRHPLRFKNTLSRCLSVLSHLSFMAGVTIGGIGQIQIMLYPVLGPFIVEKEFHKSVLLYGNSALIVGACYFFGSLVSRALLKYFSVQSICQNGFIILCISILIAYFFVYAAPFDITTVMIPIGFSCVSCGMILPNILGHNLKQFSHTAGIAMAIQTAILMLVSAVGVFFISHVEVTSEWQIANILLCMGVLQAVLFFSIYRKNLGAS